MSYASNSCRNAYFIEKRGGSSSAGLFVGCLWFFLLIWLVVVYFVMPLYAVIKKIHSRYKKIHSREVSKKNIWISRLSFGF